MIRRTAAEQILGEWGVRDATPDELRVRDALTEELDGHPLRGKPLRRRYRNFTPDAAGYVASLGGPLPYMQRLRQIEELTRQHEERLAEAYAAHGDDWREVAARWDFGDVNDLIDRHNRWFPAEARLPMDPRSRDFVKVGGQDYRRRPLDARWILDRFPA